MHTAMEARAHFQRSTGCGPGSTPVRRLQRRRSDADRWHNGQKASILLGARDRAIHAQHTSHVAESSSAAAADDRSGPKPAKLRGEASTDDHSPPRPGLESASSRPAGHHETSRKALRVVSEVSLPNGDVPAPPGQLDADADIGPRENALATEGAGARLLLSRKLFETTCRMRCVSSCADAPCL